MLLLDLPNELLLCIGKTLQPVDLKRLLQTNHRLSLLLSPVLHKIAARTELRSRLFVIHWAAARKYTTLIDTLISYGSDVNAMVKSTGWTPLHHSTAVGDEETIRFLLDKSAKLDLGRDCLGYQGTALHLAAERGLDRIVGLLLELGADINSRTRYGRTPLHLAVRKEHEGVVRLLLKNHADIECKDNIWCTALHYAAQMKIFVPWTELNTENLWEISLPCLPINHQRIGIITALLEAGADTTATDGDHQTPLQLAAKYDDSGKIVTMLLDHGPKACTEFKSREGEPPLYLAVCGRAFERMIPVKEIKRVLPVKALLEKGVHPDLQNISGVTALHRAASLGYAGISRGLLDRGASVTIQDSCFRTALHHVFMGAYDFPKNDAYPELARLLVERGANVRAEWAVDRTVSYWPQRNKQLVDFVKEMGMNPPDYIDSDNLYEGDAIRFGEMGGSEEEEEEESDFVTGNEISR